MIKKAEKIINIISVNMNFSDSGFQEFCKKTELSNNKNNISVQDADENIEKEMKTYMELSDVIELSSDSGDEDSTYYMTTVWDISDIETRSPSVITSSPPYNGEVSGMVSDNIEILEENNNDPNNNLDFNEIPQESNGNRNIDDISKDRIDYSRELTSPIPGCSKDINNVENSTENSIYHKLYKDATLISTLLPDVEFGLILEMLKKNQYAKNYCELALWDLLPDKRPMPQVLLSKRKLTDDTCEVEQKRYMSKELDIVPNEVRTNIEMTKALCTVSSKEKENLNIKESINSKTEEKETINDTERDKHPRVNIESETNEATCDANEQYENMLGIFPDADPVYLKDIVKNMYNKPEELKAFVQSKLETHDYPTREQYLAKRKITEQQKQYTTDFRIDKFLEIYPCPFTHFEDPKRQCSFNSIAFEFLKYYYNKLKTCTILLVYGQNKHNLTLTASTLDKVKPEMKTKRKSLYLPPKDIPLLQELTFIQHRSEILTYLKKLQQEETMEFQRLKKSKGLLQCQCCFDDECMPSKCSSCDNGHTFCNTCIIKGVELKLAESETHIHCFVNCTSEFSLSTLQKVLSPTTFSILLRKRQEAEIMAAGLEGLVSCPFCHFASIPPPEDKVFKCFNPDCMKESCRLCKQLNHVPLNCGEAESEKAHHYLEEKMTEALIHKCYKCNRPFFKEEGCNKMVCVCGAEMCYICDKPVNGYKHFRGQGSTQTDLCPLWSDNHVINAKAVLQIAQETEREIRQKNPNIKLVTNGLLPKIPHRRKGPHDDIPNSDVVPKHAHRIAIARMIPENLCD
ncbi:E3 ubiquitin-protein ligase RNF216-like isoform X2 [Vespa crabro]|uniref:E3 ubiquitin-protein ligase RNF216-like isoform X2 n=1 Tax=Vespa crabro TaxID=7445 RepID=UPI001F01E608|nr:E3 ubiquitin-protein ligase RNF216-like isoform X2 [Vespa crabro]